MEKIKYYEFVQSHTVLVRETTQYKLTKSLDKMGLRSLLQSGNVRVQEITTNRFKPIGSIFEGTLN
jgi:hypothetical protein